MASTGNWSVVGKNKKTKGSGQPLSKTQRKQFVENMPKIAPLDPMKEDSTIYDAFMLHEQQRLERKQMEKFADKIEAGKESNGKGISDGAVKKKTASQKNKKSDQAPKKKPFDEGIEDVSEAELKSVLKQSEGHFPDKPELWLKDLVTYLNMRLEHCPDTDKYLKRELTDYPASYMKKGCTKVITSVLSDCTPATLEHVLLFCINKMLEEHQIGHSTYGYKMFLQLLIRGSPDIVLSKLFQCGEIVKSIRNRPERCILVMWALGQVGYPNLRAGIRVWFDIMYPCLTLKAVAGYCVQYLECILSLHSKNLKDASGEITLAEYFHILDLVYGHSLPGDIRKRLQALFPNIKKIAMGTDQSSASRMFFPSYLTRADPDSPKDLNKEILPSLVECLCSDPQTYSLWCQMYTKHLAQSRVLLMFISDNWESLHSKLNKKQLQQTLMTFQRTNEEGGHGRNAAEWENMTIVCEELLKKMSKPRFPWKLLMFFLVSTVISIVAYDIYSSKSLEASRTIRFLEAYGVLGVLEKIINSLGYYSGVAAAWLTVNGPVYYAAVYNAVFPVVKTVVDVLTQFWENTREHRVLVIDRVYALAPEIWDEVGKYLALSWDFILEYTYWILGHIAVLCQHVYHWVNTNIVNGDFSVESLRKTLIWSANKLQIVFDIAIEWCRKFWS